MKIFVDIDETICEHLGERLGYKDPTPLMQNIEKINKLKLEKSGGNILEKISPKYSSEFENKVIKLIFKSIETKVNNKNSEIIKIKVFQDHCGLKNFSRSFLVFFEDMLITLLLLILII